jgi:predicted nucleic acid-binding protein
MMAPPPWFTKLPLSRMGKRVVIVDNNVLSAYYIERQNKPELQFIFESPHVLIQCSRQVINEALAPRMSPATRADIWRALAALQAQNRLFFSGTTQMTPQMLTIYNELTRLLRQANVSYEDASIAADAIVKRLPLFTLDRRFKNALAGALRNKGVQAYITSHGLPSLVEEVIANWP